MRLTAVFVIALLLAAIGGSTSLAQTSESGIFGDLVLIPGERIGNLRLGMVQEEIIKAHGKPIRTSLWPARWTGPGSGTVYFWPDQAAQVGICRLSDGGDRAFFIAVVKVRDFAPDAGRVNFRVGRVHTPEGLMVWSGVQKFRDQYGNQSSYADYGDVAFKLHLFSNGAAVRENPNLNPPELFSVGVYDLSICKGALVKGTYLPFVGRTLTTKIAIRRTPIEGNGLADEANEFKGSELVYASLSLEFQPIARTGGVFAIVERILTNPNGRTFTFEQRYRLDQGETRLVDHWKIPPPRPVTGKFTVEYIVNKVSLGKVTFTNTP